MRTGDARPGQEHKESKEHSRAWTLRLDSVPVIQEMPEGESSRGSRRGDGKRAKGGDICGVRGGGCGPTGRANVDSEDGEGDGE